MLGGDSAILDVACSLTRTLRQSKIRGAIVGGVAIGLHGHLRATLAVYVYVPDRLDDFAAALRDDGCICNAARREFRRHGVPTHIVIDDQTGGPPKRISNIQRIPTVGLADLVNMKLRRGMRSILHAQDIAYVIALIRVWGLNAAFAPKRDRPLRTELKKLCAAIRRGA